MVRSQILRLDCLQISPVWSGLSPTVQSGQSNPYQGYRKARTLVAELMNTEYNTRLNQVRWNLLQTMATVKTANEVEVRAIQDHKVIE
jgi:hypothetical protein